MDSLAHTEIFPSDVTVGVVAHNARDHLSDTIGAILTAGCPQTQLLVYDVASTDGTKLWLDEMFPAIGYKYLRDNEGPNPARNKIIIESPTDYVLLLDSDVLIEKETVKILKARMDRDTSIGIGSPLVIYNDDSETIQYGGSWFHFICESVNRWRGYTLKERGEEVDEIGCASGSALLIRTSAAKKVGLFDERYFMGKEDGDFTHRVTIAGYQIIEDPKARVLHNAGGRSTSFFYYQIRNRWHFILKNYQLRTILVLVPIFFLHEVLQFGFLAFKGHAFTYFKAMIGLTAMLRDIPRDRRKVESFRVRNDFEILVDDPMIVREDMLNRSFLRIAKRGYDNLLHFYWVVMKKIFVK